VLFYFLTAKFSEYWSRQNKAQRVWDSVYLRLCVALLCVVRDSSSAVQPNSVSVTAWTAGTADKTAVGVWRRRQWSDGTRCFLLCSFWHFMLWDIHFISRVPSSSSSSASWWHPLLLREGSTSRRPVLWADASRQCVPLSVALRSHRVEMRQDTFLHFSTTRFNGVQEWRGRSKPGFWIVGSHIHKHIHIQSHTRWLS